MPNNVAEIVTNRIIEQLEKGVAPWRKPWTTTNAAWAANFISKKPYRGCNQLLLQMMGYSSPYWLTYKQASALGGNVRKGEKGTPIIYVGSAESESSTPDDPKKYTFLRYFTVFNVEQCDGLELPVEEAKPVINKIEAAEQMLKNYKDAPAVRRDSRAVYYPKLDYVGMPNIEDFESADKYYSTLFHEHAHSTGHESRLKREGVVNDIHFGSETYGKEELIAELTAAFLCAKTGIDCMPHNAAYCKAWITSLKGDAKLLISAAAGAQKAYDYISGEQAQ